MSKKFVPEYSKLLCLLVVTALFTMPAAGLRTFRLLLPNAPPVEKENSTNESNPNSPVYEIKEDSIHERRKFHHHKQQTEYCLEIGMPEETTNPGRSEWLNTSWTPYWLDYIPILRAPPAIS